MGLIVPKKPPGKLPATIKHISGQAPERVKKWLLDLNSRNRHLRYNAVQNLALQGFSQSIPLIEKRLKDRQPDVRAGAINALVVLKSKSSIKAIEKMLGDPDRWVRIAAKYAMSVLK